jgi:hypothetical protein
MFASLHKLLAFIDEQIYSSDARTPYRLDPSGLEKAEVDCIVSARQSGYIEIARCTHQPQQHCFDISLTPKGLIEVLFLPRMAEDMSMRQAG